MKLALYAHPFDLDALEQFGGLRRLADLGFAEIAMATSYHDGRWLQPWNPSARVRFLEDGTVHYRPTGDYGVLRPLVSTCVPADGPSPLERVCASAPGAGLGVRAWTVVTHNSRLGAEHPELCVENAFGDRYVYALCPSQPAVQAYAVAMLRDLAGHAGLGSVELEAIGWMGWKHSSHHDKASFAPSGAPAYALSLCFCAACSSRAAAVGIDSEAARTRARELCAETIEHGDAMSPAAAAESDELLRRMAAARIEVMRGFGATIGRAVSGRLAVQVHPSPWFAGSQLPIAQAGGIAADELVLTAYGETPDAIARLLVDEHAAAAAPGRLSIWPKAPQFTSDEDLVKLRGLAVQHGIDTIAIYHLGLLPWRTIERVASVLA